MRNWRSLLIALVLGFWVCFAGLARAEKIIFAYPSPSTSFLPLVVAQKKGFFDPENLQPELVQIRPAVAIPGLTPAASITPPCSAVRSRRACVGYRS
jgi:ABC-type nitrate/sulfonate/bicarbonate transport system substrate-binding protein